MRTGIRKLLIGVAALLATVSLVQARQGRGAAGPPPTARASAPADLTGYWVAVVSEDWRFRIATPRARDYESLPTLTAEGRQIADSWDIEKDNAGGVQCKAFGVGGIMRQPGRLHITWQDDNTLKVDFDAGTQTRLLRFSPGQPAGEKTWQGHSAAVWEGPGVGRGGGGGAGARGGQAAANTEVSPGGAGRGQRGGPAPALGTLNQGGSLKVTTTHFREGYLRKNGVPYSESASITEYFHRLPSEPGEDSWLLVVTTVDDPKYMTQPLFTSTHFKLEANGSKFAPTPCRTAPPPK